MEAEFSILILAEFSIFYTFLKCFHLQFIRLDAFDTNFDQLLTLMTDYWNITPPKLIISVTGGAKQFHWQKRLLDTFKKGIIDAAKSTCEIPNTFLHLLSTMIS